jgi:hypothetical protein
MGCCNPYPQAPHAVFACGAPRPPSLPRRRGPSHAPNRRAPPVSAHTARGPNRARRVQEARSVSCPAAGGACRRACPGRACPYRPPRPAGAPRPARLHRLCTRGPGWGALAGVQRAWGSSGAHPQQGASGSASTANHGAGVAPLTVPPGPAPARGRLPQGLQALPPGATAGGVALRGASRPLAGGCEAGPQRQGLGPAGLRPPSQSRPATAPALGAGARGAARPLTRRGGGVAHGPGLGQSRAHSGAGLPASRCAPRACRCGRTC